MEDAIDQFLSDGEYFHDVLDDLAIQADAFVTTASSCEGASKHIESF